MPLRPASLAACSAYALGVLCAVMAADKPKNAGYTVTAEGGLEGTQVIRYDAEGRPINAGPGLAPQAVIGGTRPTPRSPTASVNNGAVPATSNAGPQSMATTDGRAMNGFSLSGGNPSPKGSHKEVDPDVDVNSALKNAARGSNLIEKRYDTKTAELTGNQPYSRSNLVTMDSWSGKFDTYGRKKAEVDLVDSFERGNALERNTLEVKSVERPTSPWSRRTADVAGWDQRRTTESNSRYNVAPLLPADRAKSKSVDQLSMQDINRYQFRRNRSTEAGLPFVPVGTDTVKMTGSEGK